MNHNSWKKIRETPAGGVILGNAISAGETIWLSTPAGLFTGDTGTWHHVIRGIPFLQTNAIAADHRAIFAAGQSGELIRSPDNGKSWFETRIEQTNAPITCLTLSPDFRQDGVALAGTDGDGILRTTDGGKYWQLSNFGLRDFTILDLAPAPAWGRREIVFAATEGGVYQSPNGGRAWRSASIGLPQDSPVLTLAISPDFAQNATLFAGTQSSGVFRSQDGGKSWQHLPLPEPFQQTPINVLQHTPAGSLLAGSGDGYIFRSRDQGETWNAAAVPGPVLCLAASARELFAGLGGQGLAVSQDDGRTWAVDSTCAARRMQFLAPADSGIYTAGTWDGVWAAANTKQWEPLPGWAETGPLLGIGVTDNLLLGLSPAALIGSKDQGRTWQPLKANPENSLQVFANAGQHIWLGDTAGHLWHSADHGHTWESPARLPFGKTNILSIEISPLFNEDRTLFALVRTNDSSALQLWRSTDAGQNWELWFHEPTSWASARVSAAGHQGSRTCIGIGTQVIWRDAASWQRAQVTTKEAPIMALLSLPEISTMLVSIPEGLLISQDGTQWTPFNQGLEGHTIAVLKTSANFSADPTVLALTTDGALYTRPIS